MQQISNGHLSEARHALLQQAAERAGMSCASFYQDSGEHDCAIISERLRREAENRIRKRRFKAFS